MQIDPVTKDYIVLNGSSVGPQRVLDTAYFALAIPENNWLNGDPGQGSLLYTLQNVKRTTNIEQQVGSFTEDALQSQLIKTGLVTAQQFKNLTSNRTDSTNQDQIIPAAQQLAPQLAFVPL